MSIDRSLEPIPVTTKPKSEIIKIIAEKIAQATLEIDWNVPENCGYPVTLYRNQYGDFILVLCFDSINSNWLNYSHVWIEIYDNKNCKLINYESIAQKLYDECSGKQANYTDCGAKASALTPESILALLIGDRKEEYEKAIVFLLDYETISSVDYIGRWTIVIDENIDKKSYLMAIDDDETYSIENCFSYDEAMANWQNGDALPLPYFELDRFCAEKIIIAGIGMIGADFLYMDKNGCISDAFQKVILGKIIYD